jgi:hypothetical protein
MMDLESDNMRKSQAWEIEISCITTAVISYFVARSTGSSVLPRYFNAMLREN